MRGTVWVMTAALSAGLMAGCTASSQDEPAPQPSQLRVMQFNIEYGGDVVDFDSVPAAIEAAGADVVALQEGYGKTCEVADALAWEYCDPRTQTLSRFPLITPDDPSGAEVLVAPEPGRVFGVVNLHLPSAPYGPNLALKGATAEQLVAKEAGRLEALEPVLAASDRLQDEGIPVVVLGDFNTPSHRDWTDETAGTRDHVSAVEWPVTLEVESTGLVDVFRAVHPDPVEDPGLTWPAARPKAGDYNPALSGRPADRIDMTFASPDIVIEDVQIVGEQSSAISDISVAPWPTDHRAVVSALAIPLADPGPYVSPVSRLVDQGDSVDVLAHADAADLSIRIVGDGGEPVEVPVDAGKASVDTTGLDVGRNTLTLVTGDGDEVASGELWLREPGAQAELSVDSTVKRGQPIVASWTNAPGNKWDWLGVYKRGADPNMAWYKNWVYTDATIAGETVIDGTTPGGPWPLPPGEYDLLLLADDSYVELARAPFTVE